MTIVRFSVEQYFTDLSRSACRRNVSQHSNNSQEIPSIYNRNFVSSKTELPVMSFEMKQHQKEMLNVFMVSNYHFCRWLILKNYAKLKEKEQTRKKSWSHQNRKTLAGFEPVMNSSPTSTRKHCNMATSYWSDSIEKCQNIYNSNCTTNASYLHCDTIHVQINMAHETLCH